MSMVYNVSYSLSNKALVVSIEKNIRVTALRMMTMKRRTTTSVKVGQLFDNGISKIYING